MSPHAACCAARAAVYPCNTPEPRGQGQMPTALESHWRCRCCCCPRVSVYRSTAWRCALRWYDTAVRSSAAAAQYRETLQRYSTVLYGTPGYSRVLYGTPGYSRRTERSFVFPTALMNGTAVARGSNV